MARTLGQIETEIKNRFLSKEYLPEFITRTTDLENFSAAIAEFLAPYIKQIEDFENIWTNYDLLKLYLESKHMFFNGTETLNDLQTIAENRLKILSARGTQNMESEVQRICDDNVVTEIEFKDFGQCGWVVGRTSPCYRTSNVDVNVSFIGRRELVVFDLKNENIYLSDDDLKEILRKYFEPKHIACLYNFI